MSQVDRVGTVATTIKEFGGITFIRYHDTNVVAFDENVIILRNGGYKTQTTKVRMNQASNQFGLGYYVFQDKGNWFVIYRERTFPFTDGMILDRKG